MELTELEIDPYANDPGRWGASLATLAEVLLGCLEAASPELVVEVGAYAGDLTQLLLEWGGPRGWRTMAIDPSPQPELLHLAAEHPELEVIQRVSLDALSGIPIPDAVVLDGDHNYYTVSEELRLIAGAAQNAGRPLPLLILHDVGWPHARRDTYYVPERIPAEHRQPLVEGAGLYPGVTGTRPGGLAYHWAAATEGGAGNGVLTAAEDFVSGQAGVRLAVVPAFFGLGVIWPLDAPWARAVAEVVDPWDQNPLLARLEANRALHLASSHFHMIQAMACAKRNAEKEQLLQEILISRAFGVAERLSRLWKRGDAPVSKDRIRQLLKNG